jgi:hypothetical protein
MTKVYGDINAVYVPPEHRVDGYVQYISGLQEHVGTFEERAAALNSLDGFFESSWGPIKAGL